MSIEQSDWKRIGERLSTEVQMNRIASSCRLFSRTIMEGICDALEGITDLEEQLHRVSQVIAKNIPYVRDEYSKLRYAQAILELLHPDLTEPYQPRGKYPLRDSVICELSFIGMLRQGAEAGALLNKCHGLIETAALSMAMLRSPAKPPLLALLDLAGTSIYLDSLIRDLIREKLCLFDKDVIAGELSRRIKAELIGSARWILYINLLAENGIAALEPADIEELLHRCKKDPETLSIVLHLIGDCGYKALLPHVHNVLTKKIDDSPKVVLDCLDVLWQIGNQDSLRLIDYLCGEERNHPKSKFAGLFQLYAETVEQGLRLRLEGSDGKQNGRTTLMQSVLNGNPQSGSSAGVGGALTFLHSLGDALGLEGSIAEVITLEVLPWNSVDPSAPLIRAGQGGHSILRVPVCSLPTADPEDLMIHEFGIRRSIELALAVRGIEPNLIHVRYTDHLAKAMMILAGKIGSRFVFTLTADPHRDFVDPERRLLPMDEPQLLFNLNKVFIADNILEKASGILGIAHGNTDAQLPPYFPKLCLGPRIQSVPVRVIPEGIRIDAEAPVEESPLSVLIDHPGHFKLDKSAAHRPVILNVGRLVAAKGQHRLLSAWADSSLNQVYNLVLIGGNISEPSPEEAHMIREIESTMEQHPRLIGHFCHLAGLDNASVRRIESALIEMQEDQAQVYLCSSVKEEFGIAILEAMAAGFLVLAPIRGGVSTYVENGKSGFLIDTTTALTLREAAEQILLSKPPARLLSISSAGCRFVLDNFGIKKIAVRFAEFYKQVLEEREKS